MTSRLRAARVGATDAEPRSGPRSGFYVIGNLIGLVATYALAAAASLSYSRELTYAATALICDSVKLCAIGCMMAEVSGFFGS